MKKKPTIVYVIDNLGRGGAETLLVGILPDIALRYTVVLVTLTDKCDFGPQELKDCQTISLGFKGKRSFITVVIKLRKLLKKYNPAIIHTHLTMSSQVARLANNGKFPLIYSVHSVLSSNIFSQSWYLKKMEQLLFSQKNSLIAVSSVVLKDYEKHIGKLKNAYVIDNYIADEFLQAGKDYQVFSEEKPIKMVAVGNIKGIKNYEYLLAAFENMDSHKVVLDIYGDGDASYTKQLQTVINQKKIPVNFKGPLSSIHTILSRYHFFVMSSKNEGFGIAAIEAMAIGLPLILSDIEIFRNITYQNALFFNLNDTGSFVNIIDGIENKRYDLMDLSAEGKHIVRSHYTREKYIDKILSVYETLANKQGDNVS